jgi:hypothetical protein
MTGTGRRAEQNPYPPLMDQIGRPRRVSQEVVHLLNVSIALARHRLGANLAGHGLVTLPRLSYTP